ncbi:MAG: GIY-YIG nuclease family protein [Flavobacteriaceae bacterium]
MKLSYVYILLCSDNTYYVGVTSNLEKRIEEHILGKHYESYTYSRRPLELVYYTTFTDIVIAIEYEKKIKKWSKQKKLALIEGRYDDLPNLSKKEFKK